MTGIRGLCALTACFALSAVLTTESCLARDFYVDMYGNNNAVGDAAHPWNSLLYAGQEVQPGDTVYVQAGNYSGFQLTTSGTADQRITFKALGNVVIDHNASSGDGINLEGASYVTIDGFTSINHERAGFRSVANTGVVIENCKADANEVWGILTGFSDNILLQNNVCSHSVEQHGIYLGNTCTGAVIRNNTCFGNAGCGIHMNGGLNEGGVGLITNALIEGNTIYNNGLQGGAAINMDGVQDSTLRNNLIYGNYAGGITAYDGDGAAGPKNDVIENNTILMPSSSRWAINITQAVGPVSINNNIVYSASSNYGGIEVDAPSKTRLTSDYNAVLSRFSANGGSSIMSLAVWQTNTGQDMHSINLSSLNVAAQFANWSLANYRLAPTSQMINAGTSLNASAWDIEGNPRPVAGLYDIGAYERILPGDANADGKVSFADYLVLESNFGRSGANWLQGDFSRDGTVSFADYLLLESYFGQSIPEPTSLALLACGLLAVRRKRS